MKIKLLSIITIILMSAAVVASAAPIDLLPGQLVGSVTVDKDGGEQINLGKIGKVYILSFFIPGNDKDKKQLLALQKTLKTKAFSKVLFYAVTRGKDEKEQAKARDFLNDAGIKAQLLFEGKKLTAARKFGARTFPVFYIVDESAVVRAIMEKVTVPPRSLSFESILTAIVNGKEIPYIDLIPANPNANPSRSLIGKPAPDFALLDMKGRHRSLSSYEGRKNVILVFWSATCPHCLKELPEIQQYYLSRRFDYEFEVLAITSVNDERMKKKVDEVVSRNMFTFPMIVDKEMKLIEEYKISGVPAAFFIDKDGIVREVLTGSIRNFTKTYNSILSDPGRLGGK